MPNREMREQHSFKAFWPLSYRYLDEERQKEVSTNFEKLLENENKKMRVLKDFQPANWQNLSIVQKVMSCQKLEHCLSYESGRNPYLIVPADNLEYGYTSAKNRTISLNLDQYSPYRVLDTIVHESCHADQFELIKKRHNVLTGQMPVSAFKNELEITGLSGSDVAVMNWEMYNYMTIGKSIALTGSGKLYDMQFVETEAELEAVTFLRKYRESMGNDFKGYLEERENRFEEIKNNFQDQSATKLWFQDRITRSGQQGPSRYNQPDLVQLKAIYSSQDMKLLGSQLLTRVENWGNLSKKEAVKEVSLVDLEGSQKRKMTRAAGPSDDQQPTTSKKARLGLG